MFNSSIQTLLQFRDVLMQLPSPSYVQRCTTLSNATIGQHTRHIIELYQCLLEGYDVGLVCYDKRKRDKRIESDMDFAIKQIMTIEQALVRPNKEIQLVYELTGVETEMTSNYFREVMYNLEHTIHHQALIKVAINEFTQIILPDSFGVAPSTMQYRSKCVQ